MELEVSTSPRSTWVWARDVDEAATVRELLVAARCSFYPSSGRNSEPRILDLDIGVVALEGFEVLRRAGYAFRWHPTQHLLDRRGEIFGISISAPSDPREE